MIDGKLSKEKLNLNKQDNMKDKMRWISKDYDLTLTNPNSNKILMIVNCQFPNVNY